jgi:hypothetical protein
MLLNAKAEFSAHTCGKAVLCAAISRGYGEDEILAVLKVGYTVSDLSAFLESLDWDYDAGYGGQEVFGTIWFTDGTWSDRGEYDGSEWWEHHSRPDIHDECR